MYTAIGCLDEDCGEMLGDDPHRVTTDLAGAAQAAGQYARLSELGCKVDTTDPSASLQERAHPLACCILQLA